jgi:acylphosphatase
MSSPPPSDRREVLYSGRVQGVGFRYTVRNVAAGFAVSGFVRNLDDGRVQLVVEGDQAEIDAFLAEIALRMERNIRHVDAKREAATGEFAGFEIRF